MILGQAARARDIGHALSTRCCAPGCTAAVPRLLTFACGGTHGADARSCAGYACGAHRTMVRQGGDNVVLCVRCLSSTAQTTGIATCA